MNPTFSHSDIRALQKETERIARKAGAIILSYFRQPLKIHYKSAFDMVTEADLASEQFIHHHLSNLTPEIPIMAEESYVEALASPSPESGNALRFQWVVDPLDGTTNFTHGFPHFAISIALTADGVPCLGVIYDPVKKELFSARRGSGTRLNNQHICMVSPTRTLDHSLIATGFPYKVREIANNNLVEFCAFRLRTQGIRRFGAAALDLAYTAIGRLDGFWERWLKPWDTAAGVLMIDESGGRVSRFDGSPFNIHHSDILATNGNIHEEMMSVLTRSWPPLPEELKH